MSDSKKTTSSKKGDGEVIEYVANTDIYTPLTGSVQAGQRVKFKQGDADGEALLSAGKISAAPKPDADPEPGTSAPGATTQRTTASTPNPPA